MDTAESAYKAYNEGHDDNNKHAPIHMKASSQSAATHTESPAEQIPPEVHVESGRLGTRKVPRNERMAQILTVAGSMFAQKGFYSTSMDDIAKGAGVTKPLLYRYFGSKDALYLATIEQVGEYLTLGLSMLMSNPDPRERLDMMMLSFLTFVERHRDGWSVLYNETLGTVGPVGERVSFFRKAFIDAVSHSITELLKQTDEADLVKAQCMAHTMVGAAEATARWWVSNPSVSLAQLQANFKSLIEPGLDAMQASAAKQS